MKRGRPSLAYIPLTIWSVIVLFPIYWVIITSFKRPLDVYQGTKFIPWGDFQPTISTWGEVLGGQIEVVRPLMNSFIAAGLSSFVSVALGGMAAFGLARFQYRYGRWGNTNIAFWIISQKMLPPAAIVLAFFVMFNVMGLLDSVWALTIAYIGFNLPLAVWLLRDFFASLPRELEESALVDGASWWGAFLRVTLPLAMPGLAATFVVLFIFSWNEYFFASLLAFKDSQTMPVAIAEQVTSIGVHWWTMSVLTLLGMLPTVVLGFLGQRYIVRGLTAGAIK